MVIVRIIIIIAFYCIQTMPLPQPKYILSGDHVMANDAMLGRESDCTIVKSHAMVPGR